MDIHSNDPQAAAEKVLRWYAGPVEKYVRSKQGIITCVTMSMPTGFAAIGWSSASRDLICQRLQAGIRAVSRGDRKVIGETVAFELGFESPSIIVP